MSEATQLAEDFTKAQPAIAIEPLTSKPESGLTVGVLSCALPGCQIAMKAASEAAESLGWKVDYYTTALTPEDYQSTWNRMLQSPPDLILYQGFLPNAVIKAQLDKVRELNIPAIAMASTDTPDDVMRGVILGAGDVGQSGKLLSAAVVADSKGTAKVVYVTDPMFALFNPQQKEFTDGVTAAGGSVDRLEVSLQGAATGVPGQVTSYLQAHPDVKYLVFPDAGSFMLGVPEAVKSAGISGVKIASVAPLASDLAAIQEGDEWISVASEHTAAGYRAIDMLARISLGMEFDANPIGWHQIMTKESITDTSDVPPTPGSPESFLEAWHVS